MRPQQVAGAETPRAPSAGRASGVSKEKLVVVPPLKPRRDCRPVATPQKVSAAQQSRGRAGDVYPRSRTPLYTSVESAVLALTTDNAGKGNGPEPCDSDIQYCSGGSASSSLVPLLPCIQTPQSRPATPSKSKPFCPGQSCSDPGEGSTGSLLAVARGVSNRHEFAEMWLRMSRLVLLELGQLRPSRGRASCTTNEKSNDRPDDSNEEPHKSSELSLQKEQISDQIMGDSDAAGGPDMMTTEALKSIQAWKRMLTRIMAVTMTGPEPSAFCGDVDPNYGDGHLCLGDMMQESITWVECDSEDEDFTPKASMQLNNMGQEEEHQASELDGFLAQGMKVIAMQQKAPGVLAGMPKCLSF